MKHNTHIYIASKAIEFARNAVKNMCYQSGRSVSASTRNKKSAGVKELQRLLRYYEGSIKEASWAPDDVLCDKSIFHTFKLFTDREFQNASDYATQTHVRDGINYYRVKGSGGVPYKVDHLARTIADMMKLREYNDQFKQKQIMYLLFLISHYVVDAHVPMHCDLRDDPPSASDTTKPPQKDKYYRSSLHGQIEDLWEKAVTPIAIKEEIIVANTYKDCKKETDLSDAVTFSLVTDKDTIKATQIPDRGLMDFMITTCTNTKKRSLELFPINDPNDWNKEKFPELTRKIFADAIGDLVSIWIWIWEK